MLASLLMALALNVFASHELQYSYGNESGKQIVDLQIENNKEIKNTEIILKESGLKLVVQPGTNHQFATYKQGTKINVFKGDLLVYSLNFRHQSIEQLNLYPKISINFYFDKKPFEIQLKNLSVTKIKKADSLTSLRNQRLFLIGSPGGYREAMRNQNLVKLLNNGTTRPLLLGKNGYHRLEMRYSPIILETKLEKNGSDQFVLRHTNFDKANPDRIVHNLEIHGLLNLKAYNGLMYSFTHFAEDASASNPDYVHFIIYPVNGVLEQSDPNFQF
ncbi:MAG: hypothetical protein Fur0010_15290 [Bdellovibrio sp.]